MELPKSWQRMLEDVKGTAEDIWADPFGRLVGDPIEGKTGKRDLMEDTALAGLGLIPAIGLQGLKGTTDAIAKLMEGAQRGEIDPEAARDATMAALGGSTPFAPMARAGETVLGTIAGVKALERPAGLAGAVEAFAKTGAVPEGSTWSKMAGKWMHEFSDEGVSLNPQIRARLEELLSGGKPGTVSGKLGELINHPELFKNYPQLAEMPGSIAISPGVPGAAGVAYSLKKGISIDSGDLESILPAMGHEWQHIVSDIENFPRGGSSEMFKALGLSGKEARKGYRLLGGEQLSSAMEARMGFSAEQLKDFPLRTFMAPESQWILPGKGEQISESTKGVAELLERLGK